MGLKGTTLRWPQGFNVSIRAARSSLLMEGGAMLRCMASRIKGVEPVLVTAEVTSHAKDFLRRHSGIDFDDFQARATVESVLADPLGQPGKDLNPQEKPMVWRVVKRASYYATYLKHTLSGGVSSADFDRKQRIKTKACG
jgi:hypothetical protein